MENHSPEKDFELTVRQLSDTYEELALLYKLSETFAGATVDEICGIALDEATEMLGLNTAAILFIDKECDSLYTKTSRGDWDGTRAFVRDSGILWSSIENKRPVAFCKFAETEHGPNIPGAEAVLICPLIGKNKAIGALIIADKPASGEFYSNEIKLLKAMTSLAALFIENATLHEEMEEFFLGTIKSFIKAMEATSGWTAGHTERVTAYALGIGNKMNLDPKSLESLKLCCLLHDIGKIALPREILNKAGKLTEKEWEAVRAHPTVGAQIFEGLKAFSGIILGIKYHHEWWDGQSGTFGLKGEDIPLMARILTVADTFDAITSDRPYRKAMSPKDAALEIMRCSGSQFDPEVVSAFLRWLDGPIQQYRAF